MKLDMIAVGNESRYRNHFDAAYQYLKRETASVGAEIGDYRIVRPEPAGLFAALRESMQQYDVVCLLAAPEPEVAGTILKVVTSGLELRDTIDPTLEKQVELRASLLGKTFTFEELASFASFPAGAHVIKNPAGLVQGYAITAKKQILLVLPAVPSELSTLYASEVRPLLAGFSGTRASYGMIRVLEIDSFSVEEELKKLGEQNPGLHLSCQKMGGDYEVYIEAAGTTQEEADALKKSAVAQLRERFGIYLYCIGNEPLTAIVSESLNKNSLTVSTAEIGVETVLQSRFASTWGAKTFYLGGFGDEEVRRELHLPHKLLAEADGGSAGLAASMAVQVRRTSRSALGVGICCRFPEEGSTDRPRLIVALADKRKVWTRRLEVARGREPDEVRELAALQALNMLRLYAAQYPAPLPGGVDVSKAEKRLGGLPALFSHKKSVPGTTPSSIAEGAESGNTEEKEIETMKLSTKKPPKAKKTSRENAVPRAEGAAEAVRGTNLFQRMRSHSLSGGDKARIGILAACLVIFIACIIYILQVKVFEPRRNASLSEELAGMLGSDVTVENYPKDYIPGFEALYDQNPEIAGWITMPDSKLNYAVMQASDNKKYDRTDFYLKTNQHGVPFADFRVDLKKPSFNTIIYAHNMGDGQMFGELINFKKLSYYQTHPTLNFKSVYRDNQYKIFAVVVCKANDPDFNYHNFIDSDNPAEIDQYLNKILERSIIKTPVDVKNTDHILTLSTCDYSFRDPDTNKLIARLVVFSRAVRPGESLTVKTDAAILNPNPVMPREWFEYIKKMQEKKEAEALEKEQKAFVELWLTEEEKTGTVAEQYELALRRAEDASTHLTSSELSSGMTPEEILSSINYRKKLFTLFISEQENALNVDNKLNLCTDRSKVLGQFFTDEELWSIKSWDVLSQRYSVISSPNSGKFLSREELRDISKTTDEQLSLIAARQAEARKYLTDDQIAACKDWGELSAKTEEAKAGRRQLEQKALDLGFTQEEISRMTVAELKAAIDKKLNQGKIDEIIKQIKALDPNAKGANSKTFDQMSLDELNAYLATLQNERSGLEASGLKYGLTKEQMAGKSNAELSAAVTAQKATYDSLYQEMHSKYPDQDLSGMTYSQLLELKKNGDAAAEAAKKEMETLRAEAAGLGMTAEEIAKYPDAASLRAAIEAKKAADKAAADKAALEKLRQDARTAGLTEEEITACGDDPAKLQAAIAAKNSSGETEPGTEPPQNAVLPEAPAA